MLLKPFNATLTKSLFLDSNPAIRFEKCSPHLSTFHWQNTVFRSPMMAFGLRNAPRTFQCFVDNVGLLSCHLGYTMLSKTFNATCRNLSLFTLMMPFELKNAPQTFQRFIDKIPFFGIPSCHLGYTNFSKTFNALLPKALFIDFHDAIWLKKSS